MKDLNKQQKAALDKAVAEKMLPEQTQEVCRKVLSYKVVCDSTNNSPKDLENCTINADIYLQDFPVVIEIPLQPSNTSMPPSNSVYTTES